MLGKLPDAITADDLRGLVTGSVREGRMLDYKRELPGPSDADKKEFLADVSSFANAAGGYLIYGVEEDDGVATAVRGLGPFAEDRERLRLESLIRDAMEPRVPGVQLKSIAGFERGPALIVHIPKSWCGPHMVTLQGSSRFYSRSSAGKFQMDVAELRAAFAAISELPTRIRRWRDERLSAIIAGDGPIRLTGSSCLVVHLIPLDSFANEWRFHANDIEPRQIDVTPLGAIRAGGISYRLNVDGAMAFCMRQGDRSHAVSYTQLFRSGRIEAVTADLLEESRGMRLIASVAYEKDIIDSTKSYLRSLSGLGVQPPIVFLLSVIGAKGAHMALAPRFRHSIQQDPVDRDMLLLPDVVIDRIPCDVPRVLRPAFDAVWNACGISQSLNFDEDGNWAPP